jgi:hypothetical protein
MDHTDYYIRLFVDWIPFLIFLGILVYFMKKGIGGNKPNSWKARANISRNIWKRHARSMRI